MRPATATPLEASSAPRPELAVRWTAARIVDALELERARWPAWLLAVRASDPRLGDVPGSDLAAIVWFGENRRSICVRLRSSRRHADLQLKQYGVPAIVLRSTLSRGHAARTVVAGLRNLLREAHQRAAARGVALGVTAPEMPPDVARAKAG